MNSLLRKISNLRLSLTHRFHKITPTKVAYVLVIVSLLILPFLIFGTRMHAEGDDSHLYFHYPELWTKNIANSSWMSFSTAGRQDQHFFLLPILYIFWGLKSLGVPTFVIQNVSLSVILILGFVFFQKMVGELLPEERKYRTQLLFGASMYIFSPIILITPLRSYLAPIWLIAALPVLGFLLLRYIKTSELKYLALSGISAAIFSVAFNAVPWLFGLLLPLGLGVIAGAWLFSSSEKLIFLKRAFWWFLVISIAQSFWLIPFASSLRGSSSLGGQILSNDIKSSFSQTVMATNQGNTIIEPLLNLFHRQIQFNFGWASSATYAYWYNPLVPLSCIYVIILIGGLIYAEGRSKRIFLMLLGGFLVALFLFTVRIGSLEKLFLMAGMLPGFAMFRNFYNKFALGYVQLYAAVITFSLIYIKNGVRSRIVKNGLLGIGFLAIALNAVPLFTGEIMNSNLEDSAHIKRNIHVPAEYLSFMKSMGETLPQNANVFDVPFGVGYAIIAEPGSNHAYSGKSPVKLLSGVTDFSGKLSFPSQIAKQVNTYIEERDYQKLKHLFSSMHINYVLQTKNTPQELLDSPLFDKSVLDKTDNQFRQEMYGQRILASSHGNYELYKLKNDDETLPDDSFAAATTVYSIPSALSDKTNQLASGSLGYLLDATNIGLKDTSANHTFVNAKVKPFLPGDSIDQPDKKLIHVPHNSLYEIVRSNSNGNLTLSNIANASYTSTDKQMETVSLGPLSADNLIKINNESYPLSMLQGALVNKSDEITILQKESELSGGTQKIYETWEPGDCSPHTKKQNISVTASPPFSEITLSGKGRHNACLSSELPTKPSYTYTINFEYKTNMSGMSVGVTEKEAETGNNKVITLPFRAGKSGQWNTFTATFQSEEGYSRVYLFSGRGAPEATTSVRNIQVTEFRPLRSIKLLEHRFTTLKTEDYPAQLAQAKTPIASDVMTPPLSDWSQGNCNAITGKSQVDFSYMENGIGLKASHDNNACIRLVTDVNTDYAYLVDFDYYSKGTRDDFKMAYAFGPNLPLQKYAEPRTQNAWHHVTIKPSTPEEAKRLTLYLYSGTNQKGTAAITYKNFKITRLPKTFSDNLLLTRDTNKSEPQKVSSFEKAPHKYAVNVTSAKTAFVINFLEPYHEGWHMATTGTQHKTLPHFAANIYSNGWYVDPTQLCRSENPACHQNADGTYDIKLQADFTPQRWFYVGVLISGLTLAGSISYLGYVAVRTRGRHHWRWQ